MTSSDANAARPSEAWFVTTRWSVVLRARDPAAPEAQDALETLCRSYWYPLYAFVRRQGHSPPDAQDLTQEFFARLLHRGYLRPVARGKGKFRTFLLVALKRFLANEWDRARAQKRGGGCPHLSIDATLAEDCYQIEPVETATAETIYERRWALTLLEQALARLRAEFAHADKAAEFEQLKTFLTAEKGAVPCAAAAANLGVSAGALRVAIHRLRKRFRQVFREEIAHTVAHPEEIDEELRYLMSVLSN